MLVKKLIEASNDLAKECTLDCSLSLQQLLTIPGIIIENNIDYSVPEVETIICQAVSEAMSNMIHMRELEGKNLQTDILKRIGILEDTLSKIQPFAQCYPDLMYQKLLKRIREMNLNTADDDDRLQRELVIFSDKVDVTEEITRLKSHFLSFREIAEHSSQEEGRRLDFLTQEIFREINTLSNKCGTVEISPLAVIMKTEVEKIREQIQNIE